MQMDSTWEVESICRGYVADEMDSTLKVESISSARSNSARRCA